MRYFAGAIYFGDLEEWGISVSKESAQTIANNLPKVTAYWRTIPKPESQDYTDCINHYFKYEATELLRTHEHALYMWFDDNKAQFAYLTYGNGYFLGCEDITGMSPREYINKVQLFMKIDLEMPL